MTATILTIACIILAAIAGCAVLSAIDEHHNARYHETEWEIEHELYADLRRQIESLGIKPQTRARSQIRKELNL